MEHRIGQGRLNHSSSSEAGTCSSACRALMEEHILPGTVAKLQHVLQRKLFMKTGQQASGTKPMASQSKGSQSSPLLSQSFDWTPMLHAQMQETSSAVRVFANRIWRFLLLSHPLPSLAQNVGTKRSVSRQGSDPRGRDEALPVQEARNSAAAPGARC